MKIKCPYCSHEFNKNLEEDEYEEYIKHEQECSKCGKLFVFETHIIVDISTYKADCLNGGKHEFELQDVFPNFLAKMECSICGTKRELTESEKQYYNISTKEEYLNSLKYANSKSNTE